MYWLYILVSLRMPRLYLSFLYVGHVYIIKQPSSLYGWICITFQMPLVYALWHIDLGDMTSGEGIDSSLSHRQQWYEISRSNMIVTSYGPVKDFGYVWAVTLTFEVNDLGSKPLHFRESLKSIVRNINKIGLYEKMFWPWHDVNRKDVRTNERVITGIYSFKC